MKKSDKDFIYKLLQDIPDYKMAYVIGYLQGIAADEQADEAFCRQLYETYLNSTDEDKEEGTPIEQLVEELGVEL